MHINQKNSLVLILILGGWCLQAQPLKVLKENPINLGEKLEFKLRYGWFTVGRASWTTAKKYYDYEGEKCHKFKVRAWSSGFLGVFAKVNDEWGEYMRADDFTPMMTYRNIEEGKYIFDEKAYFDYNTKKIKYEKIFKGDREPIRYFDMDIDRAGMLGGFMQIRSLDFSKYTPGERVKIDVIFEDDKYKLELIYKGVVELKSKVGRLHAHKIIPILPENRLFLGEYPITVWLSADKNRLPLRVAAKMSFGTAYVELTNYAHVKHGPDYN